MQNVWNEKYIQLPYISKGRTFEGVDCWGLVRLVYQHELGIQLPSYTEDYESAEHGESAGAAVRQYSQEWLNIERGKEQAFDVVVINLKGHPMHCGVVVRPGVMMHILKDSRVTMESFEGMLWKKRVHGIYRYPV